MITLASKITILAAVLLLTVSTTFAKGSDKEASRPGLLKKMFDSKGKVAIGTCVVTAKSGTTITCTKESVTYSIVTDDKTQFRRKFWGKSTYAEISINDQINVIGAWTDEARTTIKARFIRNLSIQKRFGVFFGSVLSLNANGWVMNTQKRGDQTVSVDATTAFVNRKEETINKSDVVVGNRVRVKGLWDSQLNTITEVKLVKDFTLPAP